MWRNVQASPLSQLPVFCLKLQGATLFGCSCENGQLSVLQPLALPKNLQSPSGPAHAPPPLLGGFWAEPFGGLLALAVEGRSCRNGHQLLVQPVGVPKNLQGTAEASALPFLPLPFSPLRPFAAAFAAGAAHGSGTAAPHGSGASALWGPSAGLLGGALAGAEVTVGDLAATEDTAAGRGRRLAAPSAAGAGISTSSERSSSSSQ
mmetsp:Transcript_101400/g.287108  ORF Transcript_101400/g.287108 Transcript_101400/m.287108 type:complete len:205 (+) Transcript_101400:513-1127(+)